MHSAPQKLDIFSRLVFCGPVKHQARTAAQLTQSITEVTARRLIRGPLLPSWSLEFEIIVDFLRRRLRALEVFDIEEARVALESVAIKAKALGEIEMTDVQKETVTGRWIVPKNSNWTATLLYFHGGGYCVYPKVAYAGMLAEIALATKCRIFAVDYSLAPEHKFPLQLKQAVAAYEWILSECDRTRLVVGGDSAGGNLTLSLMLYLRDLGLPLPALAIGISPATEFDVIRDSIFRNERYDYLSFKIVARFASWFCDPDESSNPLISVAKARLDGLPPIYLQAGSKEVLVDSIRIFADRAAQQGANIRLDVFDDMVHCFQLFGPYAPKSRDAIMKLAEAITNHTSRN